MENGKRLPGKRRANQKRTEAASSSNRRKFDARASLFAAAEATRVTRRNGALPAFVLLTVIQVGLLLVVQPTGNFPLNDDWAYALTVKWLADDGVFKLSNWIVPNLLPQSLLGWFSAASFGDSFSVLRRLTELDSLLTSFAAFQFLRSCGIDRRRSFLATVALVCLPWWQALSNSYMSDMYGLTFALVAAYFLARQLVSPSSRALALGMVFCAIAMLQRQVALIVPAAFALAWICSRDMRSPRSWIVALAPLLVTIGAQQLYQGYLARGPGIPEASIETLGRIWPMTRDLLAAHPASAVWFATNLAQMAGYLGIFVAIPALAGFFGRPSPAWNVIAVLIFTATLALDWLPPYRENNVLDVAGIGPFTIGNGMEHAAPIDRSRGLLWYGAGLLASVGITVLIATIWRTLRQMRRYSRRRRAILVFLSTLVLLYLIPLAITDYSDRYFLFVFPFVLGWIFVATGQRSRFALPRGRLGFAVLPVLAIGLLSAMAVHDYFAWNRARWAIIAYAEKQFGANALSMDGGFEYNGFHNFEARAKLPRKPGKNWWWIDDDEYLVSFEQQPGYRTIRSEPVDAYYSRTPRLVFLEQKTR
jgi:hypothetical protein